MSISTNFIQRFYSKHLLNVQTPMTTGEDWNLDQLVTLTPLLTKNRKQINCCRGCTNPPVEPTLHLPLTHEQDTWQQLVFVMKGSLYSGRVPLPQKSNRIGDKGQLWSNTHWEHNNELLPRMWMMSPLFLDKMFCDVRAQVTVCYQLIFFHLHSFGICELAVWWLERQILSLQ